MTAIFRLEPPLVTSPRRRPVRTRSRIGGAALLSLGLHATLIGVAVALTLYHRPVKLVPVDTPATVQVVMTPPKMAAPPAAVLQPKTTPSPKVSKPAATTPAATESSSATAASKAPPIPRTAAGVATSAQAPQATTAAASQPTATPPAAQNPAAPDGSGLNFDLAEAEGQGNSYITGDIAVPASPDVKFHNRKPVYPSEAVLRGEQGKVVLLIHVSPEGLVSSVDVVRSSGFSELDRAAEDAVLTWHFLPSVRDGHPVSDDLPLGIVFALD